jgi:hypothetical protein
VKLKAALSPFSSRGAAIPFLARPARRKETSVSSGENGATTDWERADGLTGEEIEASIKDDSDWSDDWHWAEAVLVIPPKRRRSRFASTRTCSIVSKRKGYQRRINAVLRCYKQQRRKKRA